MTSWNWKDFASARRKALTFWRDERGAFLIVFAIMFSGLVGAVGLAIDFARVVSARSSAVSALDAAVLAGGRAFQINRDAPEAALDAAPRYFDRMKSDLLRASDSDFYFGHSGTTMEGRAEGGIKTVFLGIVGIDEFRFSARASALIAVDGLQNTEIEIALMLDTSGSMSGSKLSALKSAAKRLIDMVLADQQLEHPVRVSLVPFSDYVNVGPAIFKSITGLDLDITVADGVRLAPAGDRACVAERIVYSERVSDSSPDEGGYFHGYAGLDACRPDANNVLVPLTGDADTLKQAIDGLGAKGGTAGHLGVLWSWLALSPYWADVWPSGSAPQSYEQLFENRTIRTASYSVEVPQLRKVAVLMTDGEFNRSYSGGDSNEQAVATCNAMKAVGIEIYTIAFDLGDFSSAGATMRRCATEPGFFYNAKSDSALEDAFRDITLKLLPLRLVQ